MFPLRLHICLVHISIVSLSCGTNDMFVSVCSNQHSRSSLVQFLKSIQKRIVKCWQCLEKYTTTTTIVMWHWWNVKFATNKYREYMFGIENSSVHLNAQIQIPSNPQTMQAEIFNREEHQTAGCCFWFSERILVHCVTYERELPNENEWEQKWKRRRADI